MKRVSKRIFAMMQVMGRADVDRTLISLVALFILSILGILLYTILTLNEHQLDALRIDLAGRQRFLNAKHMNEMLLAAQGSETDYHLTRTLFNETLTALIHGGAARAVLWSDQMVTLPPAPSDAITHALLEQQQLMHEFIQKADVYLDSARKNARAPSNQNELLALNQQLYDSANQAVQLLDRYSESRIVTMMKWETGIGFLVVLSGILLTIHLMRSIRARKQAEETVRRSQRERLDALSQSDSLKSALLSSVSHELRTPLTSIKASVSTLFDHAEGMAADVRTEFRDRINHEIDYLARLVNNLLDMSRIEAGALTPHLEWHPMEDLLEGAIRLTGAALQRRPLDIQLPDERPLVYVDGVLVQQVLVNLLDNALKYSPDGSAIRIEASLRFHESEVRVSNIGQGIPSGELRLVFDRFHRVRVQSGRSIPGTGLGLAICKGIIEAHGGRIRAESIPGEVTTITFTLPMTETISAAALARLSSREGES